jgi:hypothetical protein
VTFLFVLPDSRYGNARSSFYREYFDKVRALPGVQAVAGNINLPMTDSESSTPFEESERPTSESQRPSAALATVSTEYFKTMEMPLIRGRDFADHDDVNAHPSSSSAAALQRDISLRKMRSEGRSGRPAYPARRADLRGAKLSVSLETFTSELRSVTSSPRCMSRLRRQSTHAVSIQLSAHSQILSPWNARWSIWLRPWIQNCRSRR